MADLGKFFQGAFAAWNGFQQAKRALESRRSEQIQSIPQGRRAAPLGTSPGRPLQMQVHDVRTIEQRVGYVVKQIQKGRDDPRIRALATKIVSKKCGKEWCIPERDYEGEVKAVFAYVRQNVRYVRDALTRDTFQHPVRTLEFAGGDCDDYSVTLCSLLEAIGYPCRLRVIRTKKAREWNHIYALVGLPPQDPTKWVALDASVDKPAGWQAPKSMVAAVRDFEIP